MNRWMTHYAYPQGDLREAALMRNMTESNWASRLLYGAGDDEEGYGYIATDVVDVYNAKYVRIHCTNLTLTLLSIVLVPVAHSSYTYGRAAPSFLVLLVLSVGTTPTRHKVITHHQTSANKLM